LLYLKFVQGWSSPPNFLFPVVLFPAVLESRLLFFCMACLICLHPHGDSSRSFFRKLPVDNVSPSDLPHMGHVRTLPQRATLPHSCCLFHIYFGKPTFSRDFLSLPLRVTFALPSPSPPSLPTAMAAPIRFFLPHGVFFFFFSLLVKWDVISYEYPPTCFSKQLGSPIFRDNFDCMGYLSVPAPVVWYFSSGPVLGIPSLLCADLFPTHFFMRLANSA